MRPDKLSRMAAITLRQPGDILTALLAHRVSARAKRVAFDGFIAAIHVRREFSLFAWALLRLTQRQEAHFASAISAANDQHARVRAIQQAPGRSRRRYFLRKRSSRTTSPPGPWSGAAAAASEGPGKASGRLSSAPARIPAGAFSIFSIVSAVVGPSSAPGSAVAAMG